MGSLHVLDQARAAGVRRVVFAADGRTLYGEPAPDELPVVESRAQQPCSPARGVQEGAARLPGRLPPGARPRVQRPRPGQRLRPPPGRHGDRRCGGRRLRRPDWSAASRSPSTGTAAAPVTSSTSTTSWTPSCGPPVGVAASSATSGPAAGTSELQLWRTMAAQWWPPGCPRPTAGGRGARGGPPPPAGRRRAAIQLGWRPWTAARPRASGPSCGIVAPHPERAASGRGPRPGWRTISSPPTPAGARPAGTPRTMATGSPRSLPITSSAAPAISSATHTSVAVSSRPRSSRVPRRSTTAAIPGAADGHVGDAPAPGTPEGVRHDHRHVDPESPAAVRPRGAGPTGRRRPATGRPCRRPRWTGRPRRWRR